MRHNPPPAVRVCAGHGALLHRCESYGLVLRRAEGKEKGKGVVMRQGLKETQSKIAVRSGKQKPDMRRDASETSWHVTAKSPIEFS